MNNLNTNQQFAELTSIYIDLNKKFMQALKDRVHSDTLEAIKEQIKTVVDQLTVLKSQVS